MLLHGMVHGRFDILGFTLDCSLVWTQGRHSWYQSSSSSILRIILCRVVELGYSFLGFMYRVRKDFLVWVRTIYAYISKFEKFFLWQLFLYKFKVFVQILYVVKIILWYAIYRGLFWLINPYFLLSRDVRIWYVTYSDIWTGWTTTNSTWAVAGSPVPGRSYGSPSR